MTDHLEKTAEIIEAQLHAHIKESAETHGAIEAKLGLLADRLLGIPQRTIDGEVVRSGGIEEKVESLYKASKNGGLKVQIPWVKATGFVGVVAAVIELIRALVERL